MSSEKYIYKENASYKGYEKEFYYTTMMKIDWYT